MAFPTSPSNNQVHKEGNRAFVYDSTLGTWDQVREAEVESTIMAQKLGLNQVGDNVTFPAGTIRFIDYVEVRGVGGGTSTGWADTGMQITIPSATVALYSKLIIDVRNNIRVNVGSSHGFAYWAVMRDLPSGDKWFKVHRHGHHQASSMDVFSSFGGRFVDENLGSGDHRYKTKYKLGATSYAASVNPLGEDDDSAGRNSITVCGVI